MAERADAIERFLARHGWAGAERRLLAADASFRRYDRLRRGADSAVLMDAPPPHEDVRPFLAVAERLLAHGFSAPAVLAEDAAAGLLLIEDFGDTTYTRLLDGAADPEPLYVLATDVLIALHGLPPETLLPAGTPDYDDARLLDEAALFVDWYLAALRGRAPDAATRAAYLECWRALLTSARGVPETLVLRDYHVDNLMVVEGRSGVAACGLLDFQDAVRGPVAYDFVSLVEDARRDVAPALTAQLRARYLAAFPSVAAGAFDTACAVLGAQRHCKVLGIFTRLWLRDGKPDYLRHVPRLWRLLERAARHPGLAPLRSWLDAEIPAADRRIPDREPAAGSPLRSTSRGAPA